MKLEPFNAGDPVYVADSGYRGLSKAVVARVTKTQAIVGSNEQRFNRETGRLVGAGPWNATHISHPSDSLDAKWRRVIIKRAATALMSAASKGEPVEIREAYAKWDRLTEGAPE